MKEPEQLHKLLYLTTKECPVCNWKITVTRVRSRLTMLRKDADFCTYYQDINPYLYSIWVCGVCGYAAQDTFFEQVSDGQVQAFQRYVESNKVHLRMEGERNYFQAVAAYRLAQRCAEVLHLPDSRRAGLYLRLAWVHRLAEMENEEQTALEKALEHYERAYSRETAPYLGVMSEPLLAYLIGELCRRLEKNRQAGTWFAHVLRSREARGKERQLVELARTGYAEVRDLLRAEEERKAEVKQW